MAAEPIMDASTGTYVFMLLLGIVLILWPLAVLTNFRGYRQGHARRSRQTGDWMSGPFRGRPPAPPSESDRRFDTAMQYLVAIVFLLAATALIVFAAIRLVTRAVGG